MKRIIISLLFSISLLSASAADHLMFKGIPIEGSLSSFTQKLVKIGMKHLWTEKSTSFLKGSFTGSEVEIGVSATPNTNQVYSVCVLFPIYSDWDKLTTEYIYYKNLYTTKYGNPSYCEEYISPQTDTNTSKMDAIHDGKFKYQTMWKLEEGEIFLVISKGDSYNGRVSISYDDNQNADMKEVELLNEI